ncbi:Aldo/keto reductase [Annulohypoxylon bovei var. microspora]|nr:Aldo/keto reductase [Annulohypoxylon bovei var. microspora]
MYTTTCNLRPFNSETLSLSSIRTLLVKRSNPFLSPKHCRQIISSPNRQTINIRSFAMTTRSAPMPKMLYGTAWKRSKTNDLVYLALKSGFRGIDTAAQPRHYKEPLVGAAVRRAVAEGIVKRSDLFIQTKFTSIDGQDLKDLPYDPLGSVEEQVHASVASSLQSFTCTDSEAPYIDSLVLHSPLGTLSDTIKAWKALETYVPHTIRQLGISNTPPKLVEVLCSSDDITIPPACVQNRFYPHMQWEVELRSFLRTKGIIFQAFWVLSGNPRLLASTPVQMLATKVGVHPPIALYSLVLGLRGTAVLDGTTDEAHMKEDLEGTRAVEEYAESEPGRHIWLDCLEDFKASIGERAH